MIIEIGHYALALAFCLSLFQGMFGLIGAHRKDNALMGCVIPTARIQFVFIAAAFSALTYANIVSDFSVWLVAEYSHTHKPLLYRISGVWGNHEGSMLLWVLILSLFGLMVTCFNAKLPVTFRSRVLGVQALISSGFLAFVLFTSNPFLRLNPAPLEGRGLNPILQDPGLALHPPLLYLGYVGFSISFSFAVSALIEGRVDPAWARWVRPWVLGAWSALTLGIGLGSWWAYYELGWGGWWFWDPVENASFMPWLIGTALLHSIFVVERRNTLKTWAILLAIGTFGFALLGTFLVRSGVLTSVHTFATDPERGIFILLLIVIIVGGSLVLFATRAPLIKGEGLFLPVSREGAIVLNNLFLTSACAVVLIGTLYPLLIDTLMNEKLSVGPPFFNNTFVPLVLPLLIACPIGAIMPWKRGDLAGVLGRLKLAALMAVIISLGSISLDSSKNIIAALFLGVAAWLIMGAFLDLAECVKLFRTSLKDSIRRAINLSSSTWGKGIAHSALGILVAGITGSTAWKIEKIQVMKPNDQIQISSYKIKFLGVQAHTGPNYTSIKGGFKLSSGGKSITTLFPEKRTYPAEKSATTEASIWTNFLGDIYIVLGDKVKDSAWVTRIYYNPVLPWIWLGVLLMAIGGLISLFNKRPRTDKLVSSTQELPI